MLVLRRLTAASSALALLVLPHGALGMPDYLKKIPNGELFAQWLGHPESNSAKFTPLAEAFRAAKYEWNKDICSKTFEGTSMTNGEALGDPCCTWKPGDQAQKITAWSEGGKPTQKTECAAGGGDKGGGDDKGSKDSGGGDVAKAGSGSAAEKKDDEGGGGDDKDDDEDVDVVVKKVKKKSSKKKKKKKGSNKSKKTCKVSRKQLKQLLYSLGD